MPLCGCLEHATKGQQDVRQTRGLVSAKRAAKTMPTKPGPGFIVILIRKLSASRGQGAVGASIRTLIDLRRWPVRQLQTMQHFLQH